MNAFVVLLARLSTGLFLILWAYAVHKDLHGAVDLVTSLSQGFFADATYRMVLVYGALALGVLAILGFVRVLAYPLLTLALAAAVASLWQSAIDPLGLFLYAPGIANIFFLPMLGLFVASLVPLALWEEDSIAVDSLFSAWRNRDSSEDSPSGRGMRLKAMEAPVAAAVAATAASHAHDAHAHAAPKHEAPASEHAHAAPAHDDHASGHGANAAAHDAHGHDDHGHGNGHAAHH